MLNSAFNVIRKYVVFIDSTLGRIEDYINGVDGKVDNQKILKEIKGTLQDVSVKLDN
jgi:hypothetical protein